MKIEVELQNSLRQKSKEKINYIFEKIYNNFFKLGMFVALQYLNEEDAMDVVENVFVTFFTKVLEDEKCEVLNIKQYLCTSIKNASFKKIKEQRNMVAYNDDFDYENRDKASEIQLIDKLFADLKSEEQYIITEHIILDRTFKDISIDLHKPINTIKSIYRRGVIKIRRKKSWLKEAL